MLSNHTKNFIGLMKKNKKAVIVISIIILISSIILFQSLFNINISSNQSYSLPVEGRKKVLIYDPLSREYPNPRLINELKTLFISHNYTVDVFIGKNATLDPLYHLNQYDIIILRAHGGYNNNTKIHDPVGSYVFTGIHKDEAIKIYGEIKISRLLRYNYIVWGVIPRKNILLGKLPLYLVVTPLFFKTRLGELKSNSVIIYTGCYGLNDDILANIFLSKGAYAYLSFKGGVTWSFGDKVLEVIAKRLANGEDIVKIYKSLDKTLLKDPNSDATLGIRYRK